MNRWIRRAVILSLASHSTLFVWGADEAFQFFEEEAKVVSASRQPVSRAQSPATVYVVTQEDIKNSGAQTIWDALRGVPGIDVVQTRANQGEVSIRGLDKPLSNRTLILLDGKTVMNAYYDFVTWETIPVTMQEIDRIEIVEGPASAVYGANAISGVINIITKTPGKFQGGQVNYTGGERNTQTGSIDYGRENGTVAYKVGGGWRSLNQFASADQFASQAGKFNAFVGYTPTPDSEWNTSVGLTDFNTQTTAGVAGTTFYKGTSGFARTDYRYKKTKARAFWNRDRAFLDQFVTLGSTNLDSDTYQAEAEQAVSLPFHNELTFGGSGRRNVAHSSTLPGGSLTQNLWALYMEDKWDVADHWVWMMSGRVDRHPYTPIMVSPRGSLIFTPVQSQVFRLSAGTSFRNPTLLENAISVAPVTANPGTPPFTNPPFTSIQAITKGNGDLEPERMETVELAHNGQFGPLQTSLVGFHYKLKNIIGPSTPQLIGMVPPTLGILSSYANIGEMSAWGGEFGLSMRVTSWFSSFANYSYQHLYDSPGDRSWELQSPKHKANAGFLVKEKGFTGNLWIHWVNSTRWASLLGSSTQTDLRPVSAYFLLNAHVGYAFTGRCQGLEVGLNAFNLLNHDHYEVLPQQSASEPGQFGEIIRSRWTGTVSYKF